MSQTYKGIKSELQSVIDALQEDERVSKCVTYIRCAISALDIDDVGGAKELLSAGLNYIDQLNIDEYERESDTVSLIINDIDEGQLY